MLQRTQEKETKRIKNILTKNFIQLLHKEFLMHNGKLTEMTVQLIQFIMRKKSQGLQI